MERRPEILMMRVFREKPGDLPIKDRVAAFPPEDPVAATKSFLESYLEQPPPRGGTMPRRGQLYGEDGRIIADFRLGPLGAERLPDGGRDA